MIIGFVKRKPLFVLWSIRVVQISIFQIPNSVLLFYPIFCKLHTKYWTYYYFSYFKVKMLKLGAASFWSLAAQSVKSN